MTDILPPPPVPADADLNHYDDMPLEVRRLRDSGIAGTPDAEVFRSAVLLWCVAWHQVPAGSLADDDAELCRLVGLGRDLKSWRKIKAGVMRHWRKFADGRLYHPVVSEKVIEGWNSTLATRWNRECDRIRKENKGREKRKEAPLTFPDRPATIPLAWPAEGAGKSGSVPAENGNFPPENPLNRREEKGIEDKEDSAAADSGTATAPAQADGFPPEVPDRRSRRPASSKPEDRAFEAWQAKASEHGWPDAQFLTSTRRLRLSSILSICGGLSGWSAALDAAPLAEFLRTTEGNWHRWFDLDWLLNEQHFTRLMEGRYAERRGSDRQHQAQGEPGSSPELAGISAALARRSVQPG